MFRDDLHSEAGQNVHRELGLPTLKDDQGEFEKMADELGVGR